MIKDIARRLTLKLVVVPDVDPRPLDIVHANEPVPLVHIICFQPRYCRVPRHLHQGLTSLTFLITEHAALEYSVVVYPASVKVIFTCA